MIGPVLLLWMSACFPPTMMGFHSDGLVVGPDRSELLVTVGEARIQGDRFTGVGSAGEVGLGERTSIGVRAWLYDLDELSPFMGTVEIRRQVGRLGEMDCLALVGAGGILGDELLTPAVHAGGVCGWKLALGLRAHVGLAVNPVLGDPFIAFGSGAIGLTWKPPDIWWSIGETLPISNKAYGPIFRLEAGMMGAMDGKGDAGMGAGGIGSVGLRF